MGQARRVRGERPQASAQGSPVRGGSARPQEEDVHKTIQAILSDFGEPTSGKKAVLAKEATLMLTCDPCDSDDESDEDDE